MEKRLNPGPIQLLLVLFLGLFYLSASATRDFHSRGEPREAIVMQDMLKNGEYILPQGYAGGVPSKPPLLHWAAALFSLPSGEVSELSSRLPSIFAACLIALICFHLFSKETSNTVALLAALILATSIEWLRAASAARVDMLLTAALISAFFALFRWSAAGYRSYPWLLVLSVTAAILCKGPVGVVLPGLVFLAMALFDKISVWLIIKRSFLIFTPALLLALCWYGAAYLSRPEQFLQKVYYENVARFLSIQDDEPHKASAMKLYGTVLLGLMPWALISIAILVKSINTNGWRAWKPSWNAIQKSWGKLSKVDRLSCIVVTITLLFYSIPEGKRSVYLLPIYPFISFWFARLFLKEAQTYSSKLFINSARIIAYIAILLVCILLAFLFAPSVLILQRIPTSINSVFIEIQQAMRGYYMAGWSEMLLGLISVSVLTFTSATVIFKAKREQGLPWFLVATFSLYACLQLGVVPAIVNPISPKVFAKEVLFMVPERTQLLSFGEEFYGLSFYTGRRFLRAEESGFSVGSVIVVSDDDLKKLKDKLPEALSLDLIAWSKGSVMSYGKHVGLFKIVS